MATVCRICRVAKGRSHKMSCNYSKYNQPVVWVDSFTNSVVSTDTGSFAYYDSSPSCDTSSYSYDSSSSSCDSGGF
ncbi:hypothetical protein SEA_LUCKYSOCKE_118 [Streptomyces phage LuckySocke]|jgi:hypothetical protein|nr:hypothetical protein SEA_ALONE_122 [Streptomyces phage Alone3]WPH58950.1 hypothetical protein SEA_LUCKYSOCKE_118 [Streptomyces phage LuckySocke]